MVIYIQEKVCLATKVNDFARFSLKVKAIKITARPNKKHESCSTTAYIEYIYWVTLLKAAFIEYNVHSW